MKTRLNLKPGQRGTKRLCAKYGNSLVRVRYRYDEIRKKRYKTVELIVDETDWEPREQRKEKSDTGKKEETIVGVRVGPSEGRLQQKIRKAGGVWNRQIRLWEIGYETALQIGMEERIEKITRRGREELRDEKHHTR